MVPRKLKDKKHKKQVQDEADRLPKGRLATGTLDELFHFRLCTVLKFRAKLSDCHKPLHFCKYKHFKEYCF